MERRKIKKISPGCYEILKLRPDKIEGTGCYYKHGQRKGIHAIAVLFRSGRFGLDMSEEVVFDIHQYEKMRETRSREYFSKNRLESKTI